MVSNDFVNVEYVMETIICNILHDQ